MLDLEPSGVFDNPRKIPNFQSFLTFVLKNNEDNFSIHTIPMLERHSIDLGIYQMKIYGFTNPLK